MAYFQGGPRPLIVVTHQLSQLGAGALCFGARSGYPPLSSRKHSRDIGGFTRPSHQHIIIYVLISTAPAPNKLGGVPPAQRCRRNMRRWSIQSLGLVRNRKLVALLLHHSAIGDAKNSTGKFIQQSIIMRGDKDRRALFLIQSPQQKHNFICSSRI